MELVVPDTISRMIKAFKTMDMDTQSMSQTTIRQPMPHHKTVILRDGQTSYDYLHTTLEEIDMERTAFVVYVNQFITTKFMQILDSLPHLSELIVYLNPSKKQETESVKLVDSQSLFEKTLKKIQVFGIMSSTKPVFPTILLKNCTASVSIHHCKLHGPMQNTASLNQLELCGCDYDGLWDGMGVSTKLILHMHQSTMTLNRGCLCREIEIHHYHFEQLQFLAHANSIRLEHCSIAEGLNFFDILHKVRDIQLRYTTSNLTVDTLKSSCIRLILKKSIVHQIQKLSHLTVLEADYFDPSMATFNQLESIHFKIRGVQKELDLSTLPVRSVYLCKTDFGKLSLHSSTSMVALNKATVFELEQSQSTRSRPLQVRIIDYGHVVLMPASTSLSHECQTKCFANELGVNTIYEYRTIRHSSPKIADPEAVRLIDKP